MSTSRIFAHRGSHSHHSESSRAAYMAAIDEGADGFECDIRLTQDREIVIWHDATMERVAGVSARISSSTLEELRSIWSIITLDELIDIALAHHKDLAIETKHPTRFGHRLERELVKLLNRRSEEIRLAGIHIYLMSFSWWATSANSQSRYTGTYLVRSKAFLPFARFATQGLNVEILKGGYIPADPSTTLVWTANTREDIALCKKLGVSVIITDDVPLAKSI